MQLGTGVNAIVHSLGPVDFELGIIAGTRSFNPLFSILLPDADDGTVSVESTRVEGMCAFITLPVTHTFIMMNRDVISETLHYLETGKFLSDSAEYNDCTRHRS